MSLPTAPKSQRLPFRTKLFFGLGDWGNTTTATIFGFFFMFFLNNVAGLQPLYAAPVLLVGGIWDAINDPMIGVLADRVRSRWGRRRPFFLFGALPFALSFIFLFWVPPFEDQLAKMLYYMLVYILYDTASTLVAVPYSALTPELTEDYDERTRLNGYRMVVSIAGGLIAAVAVPVISEQFVDQRAAYQLIGLIFGGLAGLPYILLFFTMRERYADTPQSNLSVFSGFQYTWRNKAFRYASGIYMTAWVTVSLAGSLFIYYLTYWVDMANEIDLVLGAIQGAALICAPIMVLMAGRMGKQRAYLIGVGWWVGVMLALGALPREAHIIVFVLAGCAGLGIAAAHVIPWSIIPDVIDADELATGNRREATYYGFIVFLQKTGAAFALAMVQLVLAVTGYVPDAALQPESALTAIRVLIGPVPAALLIISMVLAWRYPITKVKHNQIRAELAARRALAALREGLND